MRVVHVASEVSPWAQTGGLADVVGSLPAAQLRVAGGDLEVAVVAPLHRGVAERARDLGIALEPTGVKVTAELGGAVLQGRLLAVSGSQPRLIFVDCPALYDRPGLYTGPDGADYPDNAVRFAFLARAAIDGAGPALGGWPDVYHCHDWQAGMVPVYLAADGAPSRALFTVHNLAYQGTFPAEVAPALGLDWSWVTPDRLEFFGSLSFLKGGMAMSRVVTTVSPTYAAEIVTPEHGCGMHGFLGHQVKRLVGILNGIDVEGWDPARDPALATPYDRGDLAGKAACRQALGDELGLRVADDELLCVVISRFAEQKGIDLIADMVPQMYRAGARLAVLGSGDPALEERFRWLAERFQDNLAVRIDFDVALARRLYAAGDVMLMPSRFEPCGLNQMYAMRYGTVPVVHAVGGLRDTVVDADDDPARANGFRFATATSGSLWSAVQRAARVRRDQPQRWRSLIDNGMGRDWSWDASARRYLELYRELLA